MTNTDICNMALGYIAKGRITSMEQTTEEARQCAMYYDICRKKLLRSYDWGFASRVKELAKTDRKYPGWDFCYGYPAKALEVKRIFCAEEPRESPDRVVEFEVVSLEDDVKVIATDMEYAWAEYVSDLTQVEKFSPEFVSALSHLLASSIALQLTGNGQLKQAEYQLFIEDINAAKFENATEKSRRPKWPTTYANARFS